jgi:hypothetical protein
MIPGLGKITALALLVASTTAAAAATLPVGEAKDVVPAASSTGESGNVTLAIGSTLFQNDLVKTGALGRAGLQFLDNTELEVGPNSSAKLDRFVFNPDKTASEASINLAKGVFRFVSGGHSRPNTYKITTPHATLGIRGTKIKLKVTEFQTDIIVEEGVVEGCSKPSGECKELSPTLPNNAGVFTVTGYVRAFAFRSDENQGGLKTGALGGAGGSSGGPPLDRDPSDRSDKGDNGSAGGGIVVALQNIPPPPPGSDIGDGFFPAVLPDGPRAAASPTVPFNP